MSAVACQDCDRLSEHKDKNKKNTFCFLIHNVGLNVSEQTFTISRVYFNCDEQALLSIEGLLHSICDGQFRLSKGGIARMSLKENRELSL